MYEIVNLKLNIKGKLKSTIGLINNYFIELINCKYIEVKRKYIKSHANYRLVEFYRSVFLFLCRFFKIFLFRKHM